MKSSASHLQLASASAVQRSKVFQNILIKRQTVISFKSPCPLFAQNKAKIEKKRMKQDEAPTRIYQWRSVCRQFTAQRTQGQQKRPDVSLTSQTTGPYSWLPVNYMYLKRDKSFSSLCSILDEKGSFRQILGWGHAPNPHLLLLRSRNAWGKEL